MILLTITLLFIYFTVKEEFRGIGDLVNAGTLFLNNMTNLVLKYDPILDDTIMSIQETNKNFNNKINYLLNKSLDDANKIDFIFEKLQNMLNKTFNILSLFESTIINFNNMTTKELGYMNQVLNNFDNSITNFNNITNRINV